MPAPTATEALIGMGFGLLPAPRDRFFSFCAARLPWDRGPTFECATPESGGIPLSKPGPPTV